MYVETHSLTKRYGIVTALDNCSLGAHRGEIFGLLGPNGSGKSTLIRLLLGFLRPTSGTAEIDALDCYLRSVAVHTRVSYLPGDVRIFRRMRGRDVLRFFSQIRADASLRRSFSLADRLGLDISRPVALMSTGMRQKLALAAVLTPEVPLTILDEPTSNLDPTVRSEVLQLISDMKNQGRTVIFSSHVLSEVEQVCDRVAILRQGRLVHTQVIAELRRQHLIRARLNGPLPPLPDGLVEPVRVSQSGDGQLTIETPGELSPLLNWLASLPLSEVQIEPIGLQNVYEQYHVTRVG